MRPNERLGDYTLLSPLGRGGMGEVWKARDERGQHVALKVLLPGSMSSQADVVRRFEREIELLGRIDDRGIVRCLSGLLRQGDAFFYAMELVEGTSLQALLQRGGPLGPLHAVELTTQLLAALEAAHAGGVVHRDVKPGNVLVDGDGRARLVDFGLAWVQDRTRLTATHTVLGTPAYMSPEQARGEEPTASSDLYAVGALLFELVSGRLPFVASSPLALLRMHTDATPPDLSKIAAGTPPALAQVVARALEKDPARRPPSARAFREELEALVSSLGGDAQATTAIMLGDRVRALQAETAAPPGRNVAASAPAPRGRRSLSIGLLVAAVIGSGALVRSLREPPPPPPEAEPKIDQAIDALSSFFEAAEKRQAAPVTSQGRGTTSSTLQAWLDQVAAGGGGRFAAGTQSAILSPDGSRALDLHVVAPTGETPVVKLWLAQRMMGTLQSRRLFETPHHLGGAYAMSCAPTPQMWSHDGRHVALLAGDANVRTAAAYTDMDGKVTILPSARTATLAPSFHATRDQLYFVDAGESGYDLRMHDLTTGQTMTIRAEATGLGLALVASPMTIHLAWLHLADAGDRSTARVAVCDVLGVERVFAEGDVLLPRAGDEDPILRWTPDGQWLVYRDHTRGDVCAYDATNQRTDRVADGTWRVAGALDSMIQLHRETDGKNAFLSLDRPVSPDGPTTIWVRQGSTVAPYPALIRQRVGDQAIVSWNGELRWWAPGDVEKKTR